MMSFTKKIILLGLLLHVSFASLAHSMKICRGVLAGSIDGESQMSIIELKTISSSSDSIEIHAAVERILIFQKQFIVKRNAKNQEAGFLISELARDEVEEAVKNGGKIFLATCRGELVGYALTAPIHEFSSLYQKGSSGSFSQSLELEIDFNSLVYLYQIAIAPLYAGRGVGTSIINQVKSDSGTKGVLTDVLVEPLNNEASIRFFLKNQFRTIGILTLQNYRDFGQLKSEVLVWK